ncbi:MAG: hypothetical protein V4582_06325 [Pseudomonadota bacterium]
MNAAKIIGALLIVGGLLGLTFGSFSFTKETHKADIGPISLSVAEKETVNIPLWASIISIAAGVGLVLTASRKP